MGLLPTSRVNRLCVQHHGDAGIWVRVRVRVSIIGMQVFGTFEASNAAFRTLTLTVTVTLTLTLTPTYSLRLTR